MYIETRTTAQEVIDAILRELQYRANSVENSAIIRRDHPTFLTRPMLREEINKLDGIWDFAKRILGGYDQIPEELHQRIRKAKAYAQEIMETKK